MRALFVMPAVGLLATLAMVWSSPAFAADPHVQAPRDGVSDQDRRYANAAHQNNLFETTTGSMAQTKGVCSRVRQLGAEFAEHHLALDADLIAVATRRAIVMDAPPDPVLTAALADLTTRSGPDFDAAWLRDQIAVHQRALADGDLEIRYGWSSDVKGVAIASAPVLESHLHGAEAALTACGVGGSA
jgi:putative membrane protein